MIVEFSGEIWYWRGPSPYHFVTVPPDQSDALKTIAHFVTYGWGMIPAIAQIGQTEWSTSLFPKNGGYIVPLKDIVRNAENLHPGDTVIVRLEVKGSR